MIDYSNRITPENITILKPNEVFCFGSNMAGRHGLGAAKTAHDLFGAKYGKAFGFSGQSYAIPTKDEAVKNALPLSRIKHFVDKFIEDVRANRVKVFYVTKIGTGLSGYRPKDIAPLFREFILLENVYLPEDFWEVLSE